MSVHADHSSSDDDVDDGAMEAAFSDDSGSGSENEEEDDLHHSGVPGRRKQVRWDDIMGPISLAEVRRVLQTVSVTILITIIICALMHLISQREVDDRSRPRHFLGARPANPIPPRT